MSVGLLGVFKYTYVADVRGVGCIFTEMVSGTATFPGTKDAWDQLDRIWQVNLQSRDLLFVDFLKFISKFFLRNQLMIS